MRQIDNMTPQEIETLKLKGMLPSKPDATTRTDSNETGHTPGPWKVVKHNHVYGDLWLSVNSDKGWIAEIKYLTTGVSEQWANAKLIAAAPETAAERDQLREQVKEGLECISTRSRLLDAEIERREKAEEQVKTLLAACKDLAMCVLQSDFYISAKSETDNAIDAVRNVEENQ